MRPYFAARIPGAVTCANLCAVDKSCATHLSISSVDASIKYPASGAPVFTTTMCTAPIRATNASAAFSTTDGFAWSTNMISCSRATFNVAPDPTSANFGNSARTLASPSSLRPHRITLAPAAAKACAAAQPIPCVAPQTSAVFPCNERLDMRAKVTVLAHVSYI